MNDWEGPPICECGYVLYNERDKANHYTPRKDMGGTTHHDRRLVYLLSQTVDEARK